MTRLLAPIGCLLLLAACSPGPAPARGKLVSSSSDARLRLVWESDACVHEIDGEKKDTITIGLARELTLTNALEEAATFEFLPNASGKRPVNVSSIGVPSQDDDIVTTRSDSGSVGAYQVRYASDQCADAVTVALNLTDK